jgi:cytochrome c peroxidase
MLPRVLLRNLAGLARTAARQQKQQFSGNFGKAMGVLTATSVVAAGTAFAFASGPDYDKVRKQIAAILDKDDNMGPTLVRLAWHASGTYSAHDHTGGSDGANMRFAPESNWGANAGLGKARDLLESVKKANPEITYADLWTLAGVVAIEYMGGPSITWRPGRKDNDDGKTSPPDGRLPDASKGPPHIRDIFYRMGFNDQEIVALVGAHAVGRCHRENSGFEGPWTRAPTTFSNAYFTELLETKWTVKQWDGPKQYEDPSKELMMLPGDLALVEDAEFKKWVEVYAKDEKKFFADFAAAFQKLEELGVKYPQGWFFN